MKASLDYIRSFKFNQKLRKLLGKKFYERYYALQFDSNEILRIYQYSRNMIDFRATIINTIKQCEEEIKNNE